MKKLTLTLLLILVSNFAFSQEDFENKHVAVNASHMLAEFIMDRMKLSYEPVKDEEDIITGYVITLHEKRVALILGDNQFELRTWFDSKVDWKKVNDFNAEWRFGRAFLDENGEVVLVSNLNFDGGVGVDGIYAYFNTFGRLIDMLRVHLKK